MKKFYLTVICFCFFVCNGFTQSFLVEAESFDEKGGWLVDPQFVEQMGSPYLLAHGLGEPVENAKTKIHFSKKGNYHIWVRTKNWVPGNWDPPGRFQVKIGQETLENEFGISSRWSWEYGGEIKVDQEEMTLELIDLTGFDGRCDAIYFSMTHTEPPGKLEELNEWRAGITNQKNDPERKKQYDYVIVGGGIAGCASAIAAAEQGLKVALIHDRPVLGGNASSEIRVHTLGIYGYFERILKMLDTKHYPNGSPEAYAEDVKRHKNMEKYENIDLYLNWRAYDATTEGEKITSVDAKNTFTGERLRFTAPLFADCTGDGWIGYWAGAEFMYGRESVHEFDEGWDDYGELWSPDEPDGAVMGSSVLWRVYSDDKKHVFPEVPWAMDVAGDHAAKHGEWYWEYSNADVHQIDDAEYIRDHMLRAIYGSFANEKKKPGSENLRFEWISYLVGKRESRRLVGDYIFTFNDAKNGREFEDAVVIEQREVDVHYQRNLQDPTKPDFLATAMFYKTPQYYVPYRSLYSKNINNLFMAGRCFSTTHVGLGGPRVMRTTGQMGAAVGLASSLCVKYDVNPREIYEKYLDEYMNLVKTSSDSERLE